MQNKIYNIEKGSSYLIKADQKLLENLQKNLIQHFDIKQSDLYIFDNSDNTIKINTIREIKKKISIKPNGKISLLIFNNANRLTIPAANALLKILEEPPVYAIMILVAENPNNLLTTIISRCKKIILKNNSHQYDEKNLSYLKELSNAKYFYEFSALANDIAKEDIDIVNLLKDWIYFYKKQKKYKIIKILNSYLTKYSVGLNKKFFLENIFISLKK